MNKLLWSNRIALTLLSIMTGLVKLGSMPEEMALFHRAGFGDVGIWTFGAFQLVGGLLLIPRRTTHVAATFMALTFALASFVVFMNQMLAFGFASLLFVAMAALHAHRWPKA